MQELVPITVGILIGASCGWPSRRSISAVLIFVLAPLTGAAWAVLIGETAESPLLAAWDAFQALAAALLAAAARTRLARRGGSAEAQH